MRQLFGVRFLLPPNSLWPDSAGLGVRPSPRGQFARRRPDVINKMRYYDTLGGGGGGGGYWQPL